MTIEGGAKTAEGLKYWSGKRDSNPRPSPWQGDALPLSYSRMVVDCRTSLKYEIFWRRSRPDRADEKRRSRRSGQWGINRTKKPGDGLPKRILRLLPARANHFDMQHGVLGTRINPGSGLPPPPITNAVFPVTRSLDLSPLPLREASHTFKFTEALRHTPTASSEVKSLELTEREIMVWWNCRSLMTCLLDPNKGEEHVRENIENRPKSPGGVS